MSLFPRICAVVVVASAVFLSGCATTQFGDNFNTSTVSSLVPGKTTKADVVKSFGPLKTPQIFTAKKDVAGKDLENPVVIEYGTYYFSDIAVKLAQPTMRASRVLGVEFVDSKLISYRLSSSFPADTTDFDETKVSKISKGATEEDVIALLGKPSGRSVYPMTNDPQGSVITYKMSYYDTLARKTHTKQYTVHFNAKKIVIDFDLKITDSN